MIIRFVYGIIGLSTIGYGCYSWMFKEKFPVIFGLAAVGFGAYLLFRAFEDKVPERPRIIIKMVMLLALAILFGLYFFKVI